MNSLLARMQVAASYSEQLEKAAGVHDRCQKTQEDDDNPDEDVFSLCLNAHHALLDHKAFSTSTRLRLTCGEPAQLALYFTYAFGPHGVSRFEFFTAISIGGPGDCFVRFETDPPGGGRVEHCRGIAASLFLDENGPERKLDGGFAQALQVVEIFAQME